MENMTKLSKRKGVSPVIATVILVAVTITVAVAVAYWMSGIAGQYTQFEQVKIQSSYASRKDEGTTFKGWVIKMDLQNSGSSTSTLESIFVNDKPLSEYGEYTGPTAKIRWTRDLAPGTDDWPAWSALTDATSVSLDSGDEATIYILIYGDKSTIIDPDGVPDNGDEYTEGLFSAGTTINVKLHSAAGMDYIKLVQLD